MPPMKVPKLDGQGQRKLSSFFNAESTKIDRTNDNTEDKRRLEVPAEALTLWPWLVYERDAMFYKICLKHGEKQIIK